MFHPQTGGLASLVWGFIFLAEKLIFHAEKKDFLGVKFLFLGERIATHRLDAAEQCQGTIDHPRSATNLQSINQSLNC
jgi:hypothetical protein